MIYFKNLSNKEKVDFLSEVLAVYMHFCSTSQFYGLCYAVEQVAYQKFGLTLEEGVYDFMGDDWCPPASAAADVTNYRYRAWWPLIDWQSRVAFLIDLIKIYNSL